MKNLRSSLTPHVRTLLLILFGLLVFALFSAVLSACTPPDYEPPPTSSVAEEVTPPRGLPRIGCVDRTCVYEVERDFERNCVIAIYRPFSGDDVIDLECPGQ
jgi:hypothetical protein